MDRIEILYTDANVIVIYKPEGILSVPFAGFRGRTAQGTVEQNLRKKGMYSQKYRPLPVHRLDRETSGVMMFATNERSQKLIMDNWHQMVKSRCYVALAENPKDYSKYGILPDSGITDDPITYNAYNVGYVADKSRDANGKNKKQVTARTHFKITERGPQYSIFELELDTGRKNQIRAHLASKGYPIAGDDNYRARSNPFNRMCLHAKSLVYIDPWSKEERNFQWPEPKEWHDIL